MTRDEAWKARVQQWRSEVESITCEPLLPLDAMKADAELLKAMTRAISLGVQPDRIRMMIGWANQLYWSHGFDPKR